MQDVVRWKSIIVGGGSSAAANDRLARWQLMFETEPAADLSLVNAPTGILEAGLFETGFGGPQQLLVATHQHGVDTT